MFSRRLIALAAATGLALAGCGGSSDSGVVSSGSSSAKGGGSTLQLTADPSGKLAFDKKTLSAGAGKITIVMSNPAPLSHDVSIEGPGIDQHGKVVGQGGTSKVAATLKAGTYTFYCSVPGHRAGGMEGTLTVKE